MFNLQKKVRETDVIFNAMYANISIALKALAP